MKTKYIFILIVLTCLCVLPLAAEEQPSYMLFDQSLGGQIGEISGYGLSYQKRFDQSAIQTTLGFFFEVNSLITTSVLDFIIGVEYQRTIYGDDFGKWLGGQIYLFTGGNYRGYIARDFDTSVIQPYSSVFTVGAGIGIEVLLFHHFSIPIELGYAVVWEPRGSTDLIEELKVDLHPQVGLRYRF